MVSEILTIESNTISKKYGILSFVLILFAVFLNQSSILYGVNFSLSDMFCVLTLILLNKQIRIPRIPLLFFILLTILTLFTSFFYVPAKFLYFPKVFSVVVSYIKLAAVFVYFVVGYSLSGIKLKEITLKYYSIFALIMGAAGVVSTTLSIGPLTSILMPDGVRLTGLMNDPNYFSIIQASALAYFSRLKGFGKAKKTAVILVFVLSILASGSKTGLITLLVYALYRTTSVLFKSDIKISTLITTITLSLALIILAINMIDMVQKITSYLHSVIPAFYRVQAIFTDFESAVSGSGSGRDITWTVAVSLVLQSPILGIGIGTYSGIADLLYGTTVIAHNSYLQLSCEWGFIMTGLLFLYIFYMIGRTFFHKGPQGNVAIVLRDMLIIFLIGSLAVSLNNARMFWLFLGMIVSSFMQNGEIAA